MPARKPLLSHLCGIWPEMTSEEIYSAILCGEVKVDGEVVRDSKTPVSPKAEFLRERPRFVSRGGGKLDGVLDDLDFHPAGKVCLDAGASTGGFTDCLLQRGARHVHAVDVGYNQLAWKIRNDVRVTAHERTNLMNIRPGDLDPPPQLAVADLAFRSLRGAAAQLLRLTGGGAVLTLVKPQFERPNEKNFDGVVRSPEARKEVLRTLRKALPEENAFVIDAIVSPIPGRKGNVEIFLLLSASPSPDMGYVDGRFDAALELCQNSF